MSIQPQCKDYNDVTVTICNTYVISNINKRGIASNDCGTHLSSITIKPPVAMSDSTNSFGTEGTVSVIDYNSDVFYRLLEYNNREDMNRTDPCAPISITISCYTGVYTYNGKISNWSLSFTGSVPTINIDWMCYQIAPTSYQVVENGLDISKLYGNFKSVTKFIDNAKNVLKSCFTDKTMPKIVYDNNGHLEEDLDSYLMFPLKENEIFNIGPDVMGRTNNWLINCYYVVANYTVSKVAKVKDNHGRDTDIYSPVHGEITDAKDNLFIIRPRDPQSVSYKTDDSRISDGLVFVQNGRFQAYTNMGNSSKIVIPMTSFSFSLDYASSTLVKDIWSNMNGSRTTSSRSSIVNGNIKQNETQSLEPTKSDIEFECYNVMSFVRGNDSAKIHFMVFDENGREHPVSANNTGYAVVTEVTYEISGAVVKARVKATKNFNYTESNTTENTDSNSLQEQSIKDSDNSESN